MDNQERAEAWLDEEPSWRRWLLGLTCRWRLARHRLCGLIGGHNWVEHETGWQECQSWCGWSSFPGDLSSEERGEAFRDWLGLDEIKHALEDDDE